jgi:hypothetical protein
MSEYDANEYMASGELIAGSRVSHEARMRRIDLMLKREAKQQRRDVLKVAFMISAIVILILVVPKFF